VTSSWYDGQRPITLAILALGGEGGGVLADWIVAVAELAGFWAQNTSVAGVAQRTGATVYYVEVLAPDPGAAPGLIQTGSGRREPVLSVFPTPGEVDIVIASELMESGRAIQRGFVTPDRTTLITSTGRTYTIDEKMVLGDGRVNSAELLAAAQQSAKRLIAADFMEIAERAQSPISASLFGALAASHTLPFSREQFEAPIRAFGKGVESSLRAFSAGYDAASSPAPILRNAQPVPLTLGPRPVTIEDRKADEEAARTKIAAANPAMLVGPELRPLASHVIDLPLSARSMILHGMVRTAVYQNLRYAQHYLARVTRLAAIDPDRSGAARLTTEAARHIALWMCYQDTIHVAFQKTRQARMERIRKEARVKPNQVMQVREYLDPKIDEITDTMPSRLGARLRRAKWFQQLVHVLTNKGMIINTNSVMGYTALAMTARMRPLRPRSLRFVREQAAIEKWLELALVVGSTDPELAREIIECQRVLKGYGATYAHGKDSFDKLMTAAQMMAGMPDASTRLATLRSAALEDEDGAALAACLAESFRHE